MGVKVFETLGSQSWLERQYGIEMLRGAGEGDRVLRVRLLPDCGPVGSIQHPSSRPSAFQALPDMLEQVKLGSIAGIVTTNGPILLFAILGDVF